MIDRLLDWLIPRILAPYDDGQGYESCREHG